MGDFNQPARLVVRNGQALLCSGAAETPCGPVIPGGWMRASIETYGDVTRASIGAGPTVEVHHQPEATWVYLGEGFPKYNDFPGTRLLIDVESVQTRVLHSSHHAPP